MIVVSDTSPISALILIDRLELLPAVFGKIIIPPAVFSEILALESFGIDLSNFLSSNWIQQQKPVDVNSINQLLRSLDVGEAEAIVLSEEIHADYLLIDERLGSLEAERRGLNAVGLLGTLLKAKEKMLISEIKAIMIELRTKARFRISEAVFQQVLVLAGEDRI